ncbi:hypothetical protein EVAR_61961_1 [Eumeta japonica]|uniref:Uncharacterized protein n=1 Tax=Eumeta variegata TaxID=151549 RepID=A0A4C1ZHP5_EUMVA|nr:hypothetical protein EVAR_61961_1 [Eumeta japonica]
MESNESGSRMKFESGIRAEEGRSDKHSDTHAYDEPMAEKKSSIPIGVELSRQYRVYYTSRTTRVERSLKHNRRAARRAGRRPAANEPLGRLSRSARPRRPLTQIAFVPSRTSASMETR